LMTQQSLPMLDSVSKLLTKIPQCGILSQELFAANPDSGEGYEPTSG